MKDRPVDLDSRRGVADQKATDVRRRLVETQAAEEALQRQRDELEAELIALPSSTWPEAAAKARYLLLQYALTAPAFDPRRQKLIEVVLEDFDRLLQESDA